MNCCCDNSYLLSYNKSANDKNTSESHMADKSYYIIDIVGDCDAWHKRKKNILNVFNIIIHHYYLTGFANRFYCQKVFLKSYTNMTINLIRKNLTHIHRIYLLFYLLIKMGNKIILVIYIIDS